MDLEHLLDERASVGAEYALLLALIVLVISASVAQLGPWIRDLIAAATPFF